jgi:salicylate hydroxylase
MTTRIAIAGAGIGGLVAAIAISHALKSVDGVQVDVYERSATLGEVGAGIGVWPRVWAILEELGITDDLLKHYDSQTDQTFEYWRDGRHLFKLDDMDIMTGGPTRTFHRADFQNVLLAHIPKDRCHIHTGKRLVRYEKDSSGVSLSFADNSIAQCDILIGADGVYSAVRKTMLAGKKGADPVYSGMTAYRSVIDPARIPADHYMLNRRMIAIGNSTVRPSSLAVTKAIPDCIILATIIDGHFISNNAWE